MSRRQLLLRFGVPIILLLAAVTLMASSRWGMLYPNPATESRVFAGYRIPATVLRAEDGTGGETWIESSGGANQGFATHGRTLLKSYVTTADAASVANAACADLSDALRDYGATVTSSGIDKGRNCRYQYSLGNSSGIAEIDVTPDVTRGDMESGARVKLQVRIDEKWYERRD